jgi:hypothetical protein
MDCMILDDINEEFNDGENKEFFQEPDEDPRKDDQGWLNASSAEDVMCLVKSFDGVCL